MRWILPWLIVPLMLLAIFAIHLIVRLSPAGWKLGLLTVAATLIAALPGGAETDPGPTCYDMAIEVPPKPSVLESKTWVDYRAAYLALVQFMINNPASQEMVDKAQYDGLFKNLRNAEDELDKLVSSSNPKSDPLSVVIDGMNYYAMNYDMAISQVECYKPAINPDVTRQFDLSGIVARQVELQKMISGKAEIAQSTVDMIREDMRTKVAKYIAADDVDLYVTMMLDLINYMPNTSKIMCYK
jgi:hypothetical protein